MKLSTNAIPAINTQHAIPLGFVKNGGSEFRIEVSGIETLQTQAWLEDLKTGILTNLGEQPFYSFISVNGDNANRFLLKFSNVGIGGDPQGTALQAWYSNGTMYIIHAGANATLEVFSLTGQRVLSQGTTGAPVNLNLPPGMYFARIASAGQVKTIKFVVEH
jgi:hypothetical protein